MTVQGRSGGQVEQALYEHFNSSSDEIVEETISRGQMDIDAVSPGSVILQLRPVTENAVKTLLNAKDNNRLFEMIFEILKKVNISKWMDEEPLKIRIQVYYANLEKAKPGKLFNGSCKKILKGHMKRYTEDIDL